MSDEPEHWPKPSDNVSRLHPPGVPHRPQLDRAVQGAIGTQLRTMYQQLADQPIPDRLLQLLDRIAELDRGRFDDR